MKSSTIVIPIPPSVNNVWTIARRRNRANGKAYSTFVRTSHYKRWIKEVVVEIRLGVHVATNPVRAIVTVRGGHGWGERRDIDNVLKASLDALVKAERIPDDSCRHVLHAEAIYLLPLPGKPAQCWLTVQEVSQEEYTIDETDSCDNK